MNVVRVIGDDDFERGPLVLHLTFPQNEGKWWKRLGKDVSISQRSYHVQNQAGTHVPELNDPADDGMCVYWYMLGLQHQVKTHIEAITETSIMHQALTDTGKMHIHDISETSKMHNQVIAETGKTHILTVTEMEANRKYASKRNTFSQNVNEYLRR